MITAETLQDFGAEQVETSFRYLSGYAKPRPLDEQVRTLQALFPGLGPADVGIGQRRLPRLAEGYFAIPRWQAVAPSYAEAVRRVLGLLETARLGAFFNNRDGQVTDERLRQLPAATAGIEAAAAEQPDRDILILPAQFGLRHRGRSVRGARSQFAPGEYGLGAFHIGIMVLTHPERLGDFDDLYVDAPGDEFDDAAADSRFGRTPCFCFEHNKLEFGTHWTDRVYDYNGCATAFTLAGSDTIAAPREVLAGDFAGEEVPANGYPVAYRTPSPVDAQLAILRHALPALRADPAFADRPLPPHAEGWFAIPRWQAVAPTYEGALEHALELLAAARNGRFFNYRRGRLGAKVLRQHEGTVSALAALAEAQPGCDIVMVPAQFGLRHAGRSIRRAREAFSPGEFGLGAFEVTMMLLTHPGRLSHNDDLWPDCAGDEYDDAARPERYGRAPRFIFDGGEEEFGTHWINRPEDTDGSVTGFLPEAVR